MRITEQSSKYNDLEKMSTSELLSKMNDEDKLVPLAIERCLSQIESFINESHEKMENGGRLFYIGAGTSGRLGIVDASECPPTFGVPHGLVIGIIAGGDTAIRKAVEFAEDNKKQGWQDLQEFDFNEKDSLIGIAASGSTPYVIGAIEEANNIGALTAGITNNPNSKLSAVSKHAIIPIVGPEFITGSTRMKSGTSQKLILNMISTSLMIKLGKVKGNKMVDMQLSNDKLVDRGTKMIMSELNIDYNKAHKLLNKYGSVRKAIEMKII